MIIRALVTASLLIAVAAAPAAADFTPGAAGAGDPFYPNAGNGGYDVRHYALKLDYEPQNEQLAGDVTISARATQDLSSFNLDLRGFNVSSVTVNGSAASSRARGRSSRSRLRAGSAAIATSRSACLRRPRELRARPGQVEGRMDSRPTTAPLS